MTYDLRHEAWLAYRRRAGAIEWGTIASIVRDIGGSDPIVAIASPRADFDGAITEFLIGLFTAAFAPRNEAEWHARWQSPPDEAQLQGALDALPDAFDLEGDGPRFLQDASPADLIAQPVEPIQDLLLNAKNSGLFIKPGVVNAMGRPAAAMALLVVQTYSTAGGRGWRTSIRGGGPLTTIVDPRAPDAPEVPLWHLLWANVETTAQLESHRRRGGCTAVPDIYPWLAPTRTSAKNESTTPADAHALQAYFGMPRRLRLEVSHARGMCDITGLPDDHMVTGLRGKSYGVNYVGWLHPLSPYYQGKQENEKLPVHPQPGGVGWRDWLNLLYDQPKAGTQPAMVVTHFRTYRARQINLSSYAVRTFGYDASNATLRAWISSALPEFNVMDERRLNEITSAVGGLIDATDIAAFVLKTAVINVLYARGEEVKRDPANVRQSLWDDMERVAYESIARLIGAANLQETVRSINEHFRKTLAQTAARVFDEHTPSDSSDPAVLRRLVKARWSLVTTLAGHGKLGAKLFGALAMVSPAAKKKRVSAKSSKPNEKSGVVS